MGRILLVLRLVIRDVRRHPAPAAMLVLSLTAATTMLSLGASLNGATERLYQQTRAATSGPDVVGMIPGDDRAATSALTSLATAPGVVASSRRYRQYYAKLTTRGDTANVVALEADATPGPIDHPMVTSGTWVRPGAVVVERGYATALGVRVGDHVSIAARSYPVAGIAVTAARNIYPWAQMEGADGGYSHHAGLVWMNTADTRALAAAKVPVTSLIYVKLRDAQAAPEFMDAYYDHVNAIHGPGAAMNSSTWQVISGQDSTLLSAIQPILVIGSWLLSFLAIVGVSSLAAGRAAQQTRRVGLLKAVGAGPALIATVLLTEYLTLALLADALGVAVARLMAPGIINPSDSLLTISTWPSSGIVTMTTFVAIGVAAVTTLAPTLRALRTDTVDALADTAHRPKRRAPLSRLGALLPIPLLLGVRLIARRPGRAVLHAASTAATTIAITDLLIARVQPINASDLAASTLPDLGDDQVRHVLLGVTCALIALAVVNTLTITWTTAMEARATMAIARTLGATPGQITAGLSTAQLLPTLPGALAGLPPGIIIYVIFDAKATLPPTWWLLTIPLILLLATAALTAVPSRIAARRSIAETLSAETA